MFLSFLGMASPSGDQVSGSKGTHINEPPSPEPTLMAWYHSFKSDQRHYITSKIGPILSLLRVQFHWELIRALHYFWDPNLVAFSFGPHVMCPTIEEYTQLLRAPECSEDITTPDLKIGPAHIFHELLGVRQSEVNKALNVCGGEAIQFKTLVSWFASPSSYYEKRTIFIGHHENWKQNRVTVFLIATFATVLFPIGALNIHFRVAELTSQFLSGRSYIPALLAEQSRSLTFLKGRKRGNLKTNAALLVVWFVSHTSSLGTLLPRKQSSRDLVDAFNDRFSFPIKVDLHRWVETLQAVNPKELLWVANWNHSSHIILECRDFPAVPLIGIFGCTGYFPACVIRQHGAVQNISPHPSLEPVTLDLQKPDETTKCRLRSIKALWDTRILKQVVDVGEMEGRFGVYRGDMHFVTDLLHRSGRSKYQAPNNIQPAPQVPDPESQAQIDTIRAGHELTYRSMKRRVESAESKYERSQQDLRANRLRARNAEKRVRELEANIVSSEARRDP